MSANQIKQRNICIYILLLNIFFIFTILIVVQFSALSWSRIFQNALSDFIPQDTTTNKSNLECTWNETHIKFINCNDSLKLRHSKPPYLISFEGCGNTYTRLIIEFVTNHFTGSVHWIDKDLYRAGFKGDGYCDDSVIVLKAHAWIFTRRSWVEFIMGKTKECKKLTNPKHIQRCNSDNISEKMNAIFIIRNPWNAFFSEFQRVTPRNLWERKQNGHTHNILRNEFKVTVFELALFDYVQKYIEILVVYRQFKKLQRSVLLIAFEQINDEIANIIRFLIKDKYLNEYKHNIECIGSINERLQHTKRPNIKDLNNSYLYLSRQDAYLQVNESVICNIWYILYPYMVEFDLLRFGYGDFTQKSYNCDKYTFSNVSLRIQSYPWDTN